MSYRDEKETLRARVAVLERAVADKDDTIARLTRGAQSSSEPGDVVKRSAILDAPSFVSLERELDHELTEAGFEAIAALLRSRNVNLSQVGRTLTGPGFALTCANGRTRVRMSADYQLMPFGAMSMSALLGGFTALMTFAIAHDAFFRGMHDAHFLWMAPLFIALTFPFARKLAQKSVRRLDKQLRATLEAVLEVAKAHPVREVEPAARVRVEAPALEEDLERDDEREAEHEVDAAPERAARRLD